MLADQVEVPYEIAKWVRPHQRVGVQFAFDCIFGHMVFVNEILKCSKDADAFWQTT